MTRSCLVTGGAGFIGCNLADGCCATEHRHGLRQPRASGRRANLAWLRERHGERLRFIRGDVRDAEAVSAAVAEAEVVYHLAGQTAVTTSVAGPARRLRGQRARHAQRARGGPRSQRAHRSSSTPPRTRSTATLERRGDRRGADPLRASRDLPTASTRQHAARLPFALRLLEGRRRPVRARLRPHLRPADGRLPPELHLRPAPDGRRGPGLGRLVRHRAPRSAGRSRSSATASRCATCSTSTTCVDAYRARRGRDRPHARAGLQHRRRRRRTRSRSGAEFAPIARGGRSDDRSPSRAFGEAGPGTSPSSSATRARRQRDFGWRPQTAVAGGHRGGSPTWVLENSALFERIVRARDEDPPRPHLLPAAHQRPDDLRRAPGARAGRARPRGHRPHVAARRRSCRSRGWSTACASSECPVAFRVSKGVVMPTLRDRRAIATRPSARRRQRPPAAVRGRRHSRVAAASSTAPACSPTTATCSSRRACSTESSTGVTAAVNTAGGRVGRPGRRLHPGLRRPRAAPASVPRASSTVIPPPVVMPSPGPEGRRGLPSAHALRENGAMARSSGSPPGSPPRRGSSTCSRRCLACSPRFPGPEGPLRRTVRGRGRRGGVPRSGSRPRSPRSASTGSSSARSIRSARCPPSRRARLPPGDQRQLDRVVRARAGRGDALRHAGRRERPARACGNRSGSTGMGELRAAR